MTECTSTGELVNRVGGDLVAATQARYVRESCDTRWHAHGQLHLSFVFAGGGRSVSRGPRTPHRNSIWCYPAGVQHRWIPVTPWACSINLDLSARFLNGIQMTEGEVLERIFNSAQLETNLTRIAGEVGLGDVDSESAIMSQLIEMLAAGSASKRSDRPSWVNQVEQCLHDRWNEPISLEELAAAVGVHRVTISKSFRRYFGTTLGSYRRRLRIERSVSRVTGSDESLAQIALDCGFSDQSHFTRTFRSHVGAAPGNLRLLLG